MFAKLSTPQMIPLHVVLWPARKPTPNKQQTQAFLFLFFSPGPSSSACLTKPQARAAAFQHHGPQGPRAPAPQPGSFVSLGYETQSWRLSSVEILKFPSELKAEGVSGKAWPWKTSIQPHSQKNKRRIFGGQKRTFFLLSWIIFCKGRVNWFSSLSERALITLQSPRNAF